METYSVNDWRYYVLAHSSRYDWSSGKNPSDYNHDYWEQHKDEIMAKRKQKNGAVRSDFEVGYKSKKDNTTGEDLSDYENDEDWTDELTEEEIENIKKHNAQIDANISELRNTVESYISANSGKLTSEQVSKLRHDLQTQISIANEQRINTKNSDDYNYVMGLRKKNQENAPKMAITKMKESTSNSSSSSKSSSDSGGGGSSKSSSKSNSTGKPKQNLNHVTVKSKDSEGKETSRDFYYQKSPSKPTTESAREREDKERRSSGTRSTPSSGPVSRQRTYGDDEQKTKPRRTGSGRGGGKNGTTNRPRR